jgi:hypothetical protein
MQTKIEDKFTQANYEKIASPIEIDLQEYFKIIEAETLGLLKKVEEGITEDELNKEIDILFGNE